MRKLRAAAKARRRSDLVILARTDARSVSGIDDADRSGQALSRRGRRLDFSRSAGRPRRIRAFADLVDAPLVANMTEFGKSPLLSLEELAELGYAAVLYPVTLLRVAMKAVEAALELLAADGTQDELLDLMQSRQELYDLLRYTDYEARDRSYFQKDTAMSEAIYSPGLEGVVAGETAISTITGGLHYRGYSVEDLAEHATFEEVAYLLLWGNLPKADELREFPQAVGSPRRTCRARSSPRCGRSRPTRRMMDVMRTGASLLAHWDPEVGDNCHEANVRKAERLMAQLPLCWRPGTGCSQARTRCNQTPSSRWRAICCGCSPASAPSERGKTGWMFRSSSTPSTSTTLRRSRPGWSPRRWPICIRPSPAAIGALQGPAARRGQRAGARRARRKSARPSRPRPGSATPWPTKCGSWASAIASTRPAIRGPRCLKELCAELAVETGHEDMERMADIDRVDRSQREEHCRRISIGPAPGCITTWVWPSNCTRRCS